ncbi:zinc ribbon domain-containing protein [Neobacillus sp. PS3-40]|uniref:zinc ribbon domain-containing protein n=1 Tax=Neobacillus sp. PS3-40 TaxID=3070679 RepID=UPI0027E086AC|nr:zinc ribbon domain-containing protein [Neobacillus sp. PS3-40]WML42897.1 zinc ribbon domain-containing protein [Neobacillus sp. PS3-40]
MKKYKNCQSCGMPLAKNEQRRGTEKNGEKSLKFCSHCYNQGEFSLPDISVEEMKGRVKEKIIKFGMPKFVAWFFTRNIHKLERWKK